MICNECETVAHCMKNGCVPKTTKKDEAMKLALEALNSFPHRHLTPFISNARAALREAMAEQSAQQEPVAEVGRTSVFLLRSQPNGERWPEGTKLYPSPPTLSLAQRQARSADTWIGLSDEEFQAICKNFRITHGGWIDMLALEIEAKLKEKNT